MSSDINYLEKHINYPVIRHKPYLIWSAKAQGEQQPGLNLCNKLKWSKRERFALSVISFRWFHSVISLADSLSDDSFGFFDSHDSIWRFLSLTIRRFLLVTLFNSFWWLYSVTLFDDSIRWLHSVISFGDFSLWFPFGSIRIHLDPFGSLLMPPSDQSRFGNKNCQ